MNRRLEKHSQNSEKDNRFGFCHFSFKECSLDLKLVDLTIADNVSYANLVARIFYGGRDIEEIINSNK